MPARIQEMYVPLVSNGAERLPLVAPELRARLVRDAADQGISLGDLVNSILAARYGVPYETTPKRTEPGTDVLHLRFQMPRNLHRKIESRARRPQSVNDAVRAALSEHYGLPLPAKPKRVRRTTA